MQKQCVSILLCVLCSLTQVFSNSMLDVENQVRTYSPKFRNTEALANQISNDFSTEKDKAYAVYAWIALQIKYDVEKFLKPSKIDSYTYRTQEELDQKIQKGKEKTAATTLKKGKGVCEDYSTLYAEVCKHLNLQCEIVHGIAKTDYRDIGKKNLRSNHAWNVVKIEDKWELVDVTWGAGYVDFKEKVFIPEYTSVYFMTDPELFVLQHFPDDAQWLFCNKTKADFLAMPLYFGNYLESNLKISEPISGIIHCKSDAEILFKGSIVQPIGELTYSFEREKYSSDIQPKIQGVAFEFSIPYTQGKGNFLTIYLNNQSMVTYKVTR